MFEKNKNVRFSVVGMVIKTKIKNKIISLVIAICLFSLISMSAASYLTIRNMADYSESTSVALGNGATDTASDAVMKQAHQFLQIIAEEQAHSCNDLLNTIQFDMKFIDSTVCDIFSNPQYYPVSRPYVNPSEAVEGVYAGVYFLPDDNPMTPKMKQELVLLSNISQIMSTLTQNPYIIDMYVGLEDGLIYDYSPITFEHSVYDPRTRPWYIEAVAHPNEVIFTDVYEDVLGKGMVLSAAKAIFDEQGNLLGVAGLDVLLKDLSELVLDTQITTSGYSFIINGEGKYIVHPNMGTAGFDPFIPLSDLDSDSSLADGYRRMMNGETGYISDEENGASFFMTFSPIMAAGWSIGVVAYENELLSSLKTLTERMTTLTDDAETNISGMSRQAIITFIVIFIVVAVMVAILAILLTQIISKPIQRLAEEVVKIGEGNFEYRIPVKSHDEIGFLAEAFNEMADSLYKYTQDIITLNQTKSELEVMSNTDALTGIFNRRYFLEAVVKRVEFALKTNKTAFIVMFDLDHFKIVNDSHGHLAGDAVLKTVAERVRLLIRPNDLLARYGGEEFVLSVVDIPEKGILNLVERIRLVIGNTPVDFEGISIPITASFGIAAATSEKNITEVIAAADEALYKAKDGGRNQVVFEKKS